MSRDLSCLPPEELSSNLPQALSQQIIKESISEILFYKVYFRKSYYVERGSMKTALWCWRFWLLYPPVYHWHSRTFNSSLLPPTLSMPKHGNLRKREEVLIGID